jgi:hypothetical protein
MFLGLSSWMIYWARGHPNNEDRDLWLNLGTELLGIVLTVAVVEWLFERRRRQENAQRMAWRVLHELDHAVWVWQGGRRGFSIDELLGLLSLVEDDDPLPPFTETLLLRLGSSADNTLRHEPETVRANKHLHNALERLKDLARIRDHDTTLSDREIAECLTQVAENLARGVKLTIGDASLAADPLMRNPHPNWQEWRHYGRAEELDVMLETEAPAKAEQQLPVIAPDA